MKHLKNAFAPRSRFIALEPRVLFDGAAAVAVDQQAPAADAQVDAAATAPSTLVVIDARVLNATQLAAEAGKDKSTQVVIVGNAEDGLAAISQALEQAGKVDAIQVYSHGAAGQFTLGSRNFSADNIAASGSELGCWAGHLSADADILLLGCNVGAGDSGRALIGQLAALTGADVAASSNDTGSTAAGGDWTLEVATGSIESTLPVLAYEGLLADASPTVALSAATMNTLLGGQLTFTATFTNGAAAQEGYAPFIDLIMPATGKDGAGAAVDDGITFISATYLGQAVKSYVLTFDAAGNATHPLAKDVTGAPVIVNAASYGAQAGDQLVVLQLPYASVINGQPPIPVVITAQLSDLADTDGSPDLTIKARGGFQFGNDSPDNPTVDPTLFQGSMQSLVVHPTNLQLTQTVNTPEGETVTGPNYMRSVTVTATPPPGQTLTNVDVTQALPNNVRIVSIIPAAGGTITSITVGGTTITDPGAITAVMGLNPYLSSYTVRYASLTAAASTTVNFYVPEKNAAGADVLNPVSGDAVSITFGAPSATSQWLPLDPRDQALDPVSGNPVPATVTANGSDASFDAKSVALRKAVTIASNAGSAGLSPGDELQYTLNLDLSDYFAMGKTLFGAGNLKIVDTVSDGQSVVSGSAQVTLDYNGQTIQVPILVVIAPGVAGSGTSVVTFDIAQALLDNSAIFGGGMIGDLAFDGVLSGATRMVITYRTTVDQAYAHTPVYPQNEINEGDSLGNNATVTGDFLASLIATTGGTESDSGSASLTVPTHTVATSIVNVNGAAVPANVELKPGDVVTFKMAYNLETGDYEHFKLTAYMPLPLFNLGAIGAFGGTWAYGGGDTNADNVDSVTVGAGNSLVFDFGSYVNADQAGKRVEVQFTLTVGNQPFADQRSLTVLGQSDQLTTIAQQHLVSSGVVNIASVAEPVLAIKQGVVAVGAGSAGVVSGTTGSWAAAGSGGAPFSGSISDLAAVDGSVVNIDGGDLLRLATAIENTGGLGAYDVVTSVTLPADLSFSGGSLALANLKVYRGDGSVLLASIDYSVSGNIISFLDNGGPSLLPGRAGTANEISGANIVVITYDVVAASAVAASRNLQTTATLSQFSSANNGPDFLPGAALLEDTADQTIAAPIITKVFADGSISEGDSSAAHTTGVNLVIGESMLYDIVVTLPEGVSQNLRINDLIPPGMMLDSGYNGLGYAIITNASGSGALAADFAGTVSVGSASAPGGDGADLGLTMSAASANADNNAGNNSFVVRVRLIVSNVIGDQSGKNLTNSAQLLYSDPDTDTPNGSVAADRTVALGGTPPTVTVREPTLSVTQTTTNNGGALGVDRNDEITYTITIRNGTASSDFDAFDIAFNDVAPSQLTFLGAGLGLLSVTYAGGATNNGGADFVLGGSSLQTAANANIDIPKGGSITLVLQGRVRSDLGSINDIDNTATVQWTSLNDTTNSAAPGERTGVDGLLNSGVLNDYQVSNTSTVPVAAGGTISHVGLLADTPVPTPDTSHAETVAVGELIYYRVAFLVPEGDTANASVVINLPTGLSFAGDTRVGLVDGGTPLVTSDVVLSLTPGGPRVNQDITALSQTLLAADLSNAMTARLRTELIDTSVANKVTITLGNVHNGNNDPFFQMLYLDFFVRVENLASVDTADSLRVTADFFSGALKQTSTPAATENVVEPNLRDLQKTVTDFNPNTAGSTGTATVTLGFSNSGDGIGYDAHLTDAVTGGSNYQLSAVQINGTTYAPGSLPAGVTVATTGGITADFSTVATGASIKLIYTVDVPNTAAIASTNATLNWSSLPESFTSGSAVSGGGGVLVGADGTASGERDGSGVTTAPNTYVVSEGAGLGIISGVLWDDTLTPDAVDLTPSGTRLANQTVTLTWAGADGDLATTADNRSFTAVTDSNGVYHFGVLPSGNFKVVAVNPVNGYVFGGDTDNAVARIDSDGGVLGTVLIPVLGEGASASAVVGYVRDNDAPVNTLPANLTIFEDNQPIPGNPPGPAVAITGIFISDIDVDALDMTVRLTVAHGTVNLTLDPAVTVVAGTLGTATVTLQGARDKLNTTLQTLLYTPTLNYNGTDTLTITSNDLGHTGNNDSNLMPNEPTDAMSDTDRLTITITPVNDAPSGVDDVMSALEKGGSLNTTGGHPGAINVLKNDTDVDIATNGDVLTVSKIGLGTGAPGNAVGGLLATSVVGAYGTLSIGSRGNAEYVIDETNTAVQALRLYGNTLGETFTYEFHDAGGLTSTAMITVTIHGANDTPIGVDDNGSATEAGGELNNIPGSPAGGNVLTNDIDVDANGEGKTVTGIRYKKEGVGGVMTGVPGNNTDVTMAGSYGSLAIRSDGTYSYVVNDAAVAVQRMVTGDTSPLFEYFSYVVTDALGDSDVAQIRITINGADDNPLASDDQAAAQAQAIAGGTDVGGVITGGTEQGVEANPTGNVITFASRPGTVTQPGGNGVDTDVDRTDTPNTLLKVTGIRTGTELAGGAFNAVAAATTSATGTAIVGTYGTLKIGANGSFFYDVDSRNATVQGLATGATRTETFTYQITDNSTPGLTDIAQLVITVRGINDPPVAQDVTVLAREAGGIANGTLGLDPVGDAMSNDRDPDGDTIRVAGIRTGAELAGGTFGTVFAGSTSANGTAIAGTYGTLTIGADGTYKYVVNNNDDIVQALRLTGQTLSEIFTYQITDNATTPETDLAQIVVIIGGANDNPVAIDNTATAVEAGGLNNAIAGSNPSGNVLTNDTDKDSSANGETSEVSGFRTGTEAAGSGTAGVLGTELRGTYGWLTLNADGSYAYRLDNTNAAVQALRTTSNTLGESFTYTVSDASQATDLAQLTITIRGANDTPVASPDTAVAFEAGGTNNATAGTDPTGNVLSNDTDVDAAVNGENKAIFAFANNASVAGTVGSALAGTYGSLTLNADGSYTYVVDNSNPVVQALRQRHHTLSETFDYTMIDAAGAVSSSTLTVTIRGANDTPLALNDTAIAVEAGGIANGTPGINPNGNVLSNDSDVDSAAYGETKAVAAIAGGTVGGATTGTYGTLTLNADGSYNYVVNNANATVQALRLPTDRLSETFTYTMRDTAGDLASATLTVTIRGANDNPVAADNTGLAAAPSPGSVGRNPFGNVLPNDTDVDSNDTKTVTGIRAGSELAGGLLTTVAGGTSASTGQVISGTYGDLKIGADGSYTYTVDAAKTAALRPEQIVNDFFTYEVTDAGGLTDLAQYKVILRGANYPPVAQDEIVVAIEAGGIANGTPGLNPAGDATAADFDAEGDVLSVTLVRTGPEAGSGSSGTLGAPLRGNYGWLTLNANGSYSYVVDNTMAAVEALRTSGNTLTDTFTYTVSDTYDATDQAAIIVTIQGANDTPVALDDVGTVDNPAAVYDTSSGNLLDNDSDIDAYGETKNIASFANAGGAQASAGGSLAGKYGNLVVNADGSYRYVVFNPDASIRVAGAAPDPSAQFFVEIFVYTVRDAAGATAQATLSIALDVATPHQDAPASPFIGPDDPRLPRQTFLLNFTPIVYVERIVEQIQRNISLSDRRNEGARPQLAAWPEIQAQSIGAGLGVDRDLFVQQGVRGSQYLSRYDASIVDARAGLVTLSADGLLPDDSLFTPDEEEQLTLVKVPPKRAASPSFSEQLQKSAEKVRPLSAVQRLAAQVTEKTRRL